MLGRDHDGGGANRLTVNIAQGDLAFRIGAELRCQARVAVLGHAAQNGVGIMDRRRHQGVGFIAGIAEHDALVARPDVLVAGGIDALGNINGLGVEVDLHLGFFPMKTILFIADTAYRIAGRLFHGCLVVGNFGGAAHFAG